MDVSRLFWSCTVLTELNLGAVLGGKDRNCREIDLTAAGECTRNEGPLLGYGYDDVY